MAKLARKLRTALPSERLHHDEGLHCNAFLLMFETVTIAYIWAKRAQKTDRVRIAPRDVPASTRWDELQVLFAAPFGRANHST